MKILHLSPFILLLFIFLISCSGFLDERPNKGILIPTSLADIRALLDNDGELNLVPAYGVVSSDDIEISSEGWASLSNIAEQNAYIWNEEIYSGEGSADWAFGYRTIFIANVALEQLEGLPSTSEAEQLRGEALFHRAHAHFMLAQLFAEPYEVSNPGMGIPLRLDTEILEQTPRADNVTLYQQILEDLNEAFALLPEFGPVKTRPSKIAAKALLARVYLTMEDYELAAESAEWVLNRPELSLLNFTELNATVNYPFPKYNSEVIFHAGLVSISSLTVGNSNVWIHPEILESYKDGDLRKALFSLPRPNGGTSFKGQYTGNFTRFGGLALDEIYFIQAECLARRGADSKARGLLDELLETRFEGGMYSGTELISGVELTKLILEEKRKSMIYRGVNWIDLRRLNQESEFARTLSRNLNGSTYQLEPMSKKYVLPIPLDELNLNPIPQNDRGE